MKNMLHILAYFGFAKIMSMLTKHLYLLHVHDNQFLSETLAESLIVDFGQGFLFLDGLI